MPEQAKLSVMTPEHPKWATFIKALGGPLGCHFRNSRGGIKWDCCGTTERPKARTIMEAITGVDVDASIAYFDTHGGHCDCEILFNVEKRSRPTGSVTDRA